MSSSQEFWIMNLLLSPSSPVSGCLIFKAENDLGYCWYIQFLNGFECAVIMGDS